MAESPPAPGTPSLPPSPVPFAPAGPSPRSLFVDMENELRPLEFVNLLLRRRRLVMGAPLVAAVAALLLSFAIRPTYTATTSFVPEGGGEQSISPSLGSLADVAGQLGVTFGTKASQSPEFYADLVRSRELMERTLLTRYPLPGADSGSADSTTLLLILDPGGRSPADSLYRGVKKLRKLVSTDINRRTGVVQLSVDAKDPVLAALVARRLVAYLNDFNTHSRQSQARERRKFAEQRLAEAEVDLRRAEDELKTFYQRNRSWQQAPQLAFEEGRLRRQVDIQQDVYLTVRREYERARIDEANDVPVITVIDPAVAPTRKSRPKRLVWTTVALALGGLLGIGCALAAEHAARLQQQDDSVYREFRALLGDVRVEFRRIRGGG